MSDVFGSVKSSNPLNAYKNASIIKCNKEVFTKSAEQVGIKIVTKVDMKDAAALTGELPWKQVRIFRFCEGAKDSHWKTQNALEVWDFH